MEERGGEDRGYESDVRGEGGGEGRGAGGKEKGAGGTSLRTI